MTGNPCHSCVVGSLANYLPIKDISPKICGRDSKKKACPSFTKCVRIWKPEPLSDAALLKKRMLVESVNKELKSQTEGQHTRHRSPVNFQVNTVAALIAYTCLKKKPSLKHKELQEKDCQLPMICNF